MSNAPLFIVIDDDRVANLITSRMIKLYLQDAIIAAFTDAEAALAVMSGKAEPEQRRAIVFLDINMPGFDGWQFLDAFTEKGDCVSDRFSIYLLTSSIDKRDKERAAMYPPVAGMLGKPLTPEDIKVVLGNEL